MRMKDTISCLTIGSLLALSGGCGKTEKAAPPSAEAGKPVKTDAVDASKNAEKLVEQATNMATTVTVTAKGSAVDTGAKAADTVVAPVKQATPETVATPNSAAGKTAGVGGQTQGLAALSQDQMIQGLDDALGKGLQQAIAKLGHDGGFLTNLNVRIPMPEKLQKVETALRAMKQDKLADDFVTTMNHAAEQAVPEAGAVFSDALKQMTIEDARSILAGPNDAATQYFQKTTKTNLYARFYPIVQKATVKTGVTAAYKNLMEKASVTTSLGSFGSALQGALVDKDSLDVDAYVTNKAMEGLFKMVAEEEKQIRQNPVARTTDMLQKVFGALKK